MESHSSSPIVDVEGDDFNGNTVADSSIYESKRVILLLDIDCFEVQLWMQKLRPDLIEKDVPVVVVNGDGIILSLNYTAKSLGVKRGQGRQGLSDAQDLCTRADTVLVAINAQERYGKVDTFTPIIESKKVLDAIISWKIKMETHSSISIERISKDEVYIDVTDIIDEKMKSYKINSRDGNSICIPSQEEIQMLNRTKNHPCCTYGGQPTTCMEVRAGKIAGEYFRYRVEQMYPLSIEAYHLDELRLVHGAVIADSIIQLIDKETGYKVSAGVGHSKLVAKHACGLNKPRGISIITDVGLQRLSKTMPFQELPGFGGKLGEDLKSWLVSNMGDNEVYINDIIRATKAGINFGAVFKELKIPGYEKKALDLYNKCQFKDENRVTSKVHPNTFSTLVSFNGRPSKDTFDKGVSDISEDMKSRIDYYKKDVGRIAQELVITVDTLSGAKTKTGPKGANAIALPQETDQFVRHESIRDFIFKYIQDKELDWKRISKIHLTAKNIIDA